MCCGFCAVAQALAVPVRWAAALSLKPVISLDDAAVIHFVNHQGCCIGNVLYCLHVYGQPCIEPVVNYFFVAIL